MIKFAIKSLIALVITSSALLLTASSSNAQQVNMKFLSQVVKGCQKDALSPNYYKRMKLSIEVTSSVSNNDVLETCVHARYHHSLLMSKFNWLKSSGHIFSGYPSSVAIGALANSNYRHVNSSQLLDCLVSRNTSSNECRAIDYQFNRIAPGIKIQNLQSDNYYLFYVCPSCVVAHNDVVSKKEIIQAFINWFINLDKSKRRQIIDILSDDREGSPVSKEMYQLAEAAGKKYREVRQRVEEQERERRHQDLLGK